MAEYCTIKNKVYILVGEPLDGLFQSKGFTIGSGEHFHTLLTRNHDFLPRFGLDADIKEHNEMNFSE